MLSKFFALAFLDNQASQVSHILEPVGRGRGSKNPPTVGAEHIGGHLMRLKVHHPPGLEKAASSCDVDGVVDCTLRKFANWTKVNGAWDGTEVIDALILRDQDRHENQPI